jgi:hypothetical protein
VAVAEAGDGGSAGGVDIGAPLRIKQFDALAANGDRKVNPDLPGENARHYYWSFQAAGDRSVCGPLSASFKRR